MSELDIFIGREKQLDEFWKQYQEFDENPANSRKVCALSYYGMGGIGKTYLLKRIKQEIEEQYKKPHYIQLELKSRNDCVEVLKKMKELLEEKYNYKFYNFGTAYNTYMKKLGIKANISLKKGPGTIMSLAFGVGKILTEVFAPEAAPFITGAETYAAVKGSHTALVKKTEAMEPEEIYEKLPRFFAEDMEYNLSRRDREKEPALIVFIDVYENFVNELDSKGNPLGADRWFYSPDGLLKNISGVFWVICGREALKWEEYNDQWKKELTAFKLPVFTEEEGEEYLVAAGFEDPGLRKDIYRLTAGHPFYLSLCKKRLEEIEKRGEKPEISMFGNSADELFDRLIRDMDSTAQYLCYLLSSIGRWNDELAADVIAKDSVIAYEKLKNLSFVEKTEDGFFTMNRTAGDILRKHCPEIISREAGKLLVDTYLEGLKKGDFNSPDYPARAGAVLRGWTLSGKSREEIRELYVKHLKKQLVEYIQNKFYVMDFAEFDSFLVFAMEKNEDLLYAEAMLLYGIYLYYKGRYAEAEEVITPAAELFEELSGNDDDIMFVQSLMVCLLEFNEKISEALTLAKEIYDRKKEKYGAESCRLAGSAGNYASVLDKAEQRNEALCYYKEAYTLSEIDKEDGWIYYNNYAYALHNSLRYEEALPIRKQVYDFWMAKDENHPYAIYAIVGYADTMTKIGSAEESKKLYETALGKVEEKELFDTDDAFVLTVKCSYSVAVGKAGDIPGALEIIDGVIEKRKEILGENHRDTILAKHNKAMMLFESGDYPGAYTIQHDLLINHADFFEKNRCDLLHARSMMAVIKSNMESPVMKNEAIAEQEAVLREYIEEYTFEACETLEAMEFMGRIYSNCGMYKKAYDKLMEALPKYEKRYGTKHSLTQNIARGVISMLRSGMNTKQMVPTPFLKGQESRIRRKYGV